MARGRNSQYHCYLHRSLQTRLLQLLLQYYNLSDSQLNRLQQIQDSLARAVVTHNSYSEISPVAKINESTEYKLLSLTYKVLITAQPVDLYIVISV